METENKEIKWTSDPAHSEIEFSARHMMISNVRGNFQKFTVNATGSHNDPEKASFEVVIDPNSVNTRENDRDNHLRSADFFDVAKYPEIRFRSKSIKKVDAEKHIIRGDLTIKNVTKEIELVSYVEGVIKDPYGKTRAGISVEGEIKREDFGLVWNVVIEAGKVMVGSKIKISAHVEMVMQE
ncbi:MAG: YceI family protein [Candidatus Thermoplasmatota archaeon]|jgi:polyisoprenoid-binding protein YceI|nr:YceI family protein [Candidatus Thermoplasmatota archaeon]MCL5791266.1 YceI family protein [Candidatus Thermoplasmatota archaeon]